MAMPIWALAAAARRSAAAMSGRRSRSCEGHQREFAAAADRRSVERRGGMLKVGQLVVGDGADGVLELGAGHADVDELGAYGVELGLGLGYVGFRADAAGETALGEVELVGRGR